MPIPTGSSPPGRTASTSPFVSSPSLSSSSRARPVRVTSAWKSPSDWQKSAFDSVTSSKRTTRLSIATASSSVTVSRSSPDYPPAESKRSIRLTVKMPSSKLREVTGASSRDTTASRRSVNIFTDNPVMSGPRRSRPRRKMVEIDTSDEDDIGDQEDEVDDYETPGDDDGDADVEGDVDMDDATPQPPVSRRQAKSTASRLTSGKGTKKSVEAKEMEHHEDDEEEDEEELSDLESDEDGEEGETGDLAEGEVPDETGNTNGEGELDVDEVDADDIDSDEANATEDAGKMTKRQRGSLGSDFLQLPMEPQVKKHLTAEERAMRRTEMARRRKNLSEKRNEEEKMDTINRLLRKQAPKRRGRMSAIDPAIGTPAEQEEPEGERPDPTVVRWVSNSEGCKLGVPVEWFGTPAGRLFGELPKRSKRLIEEV